MGRPRPNPNESAGPTDTGYGNGEVPEDYPLEPYPTAESPVDSQPPPYPPPAAPYPPSDTPAPYPPTAAQYPPSGTPAPYPPTAAPYPPMMSPNVSVHRVPPSPLNLQPAVQWPPPSPNMNVAPTVPSLYPPPSPLGPPQYAVNLGEPWSSELFDCDMNQDIVIATAICPCVTFGQIAEIVDEGQTTCLLAGLLYLIMIPALFTCSALSSNYRRKLREKYNLAEVPSDDCTVHLINPCCALCQEYRELQKRGFDPSLGWMANLALQQQDTSMAPPGNQFMNR